MLIKNDIEMKEIYEAIQIGIKKALNESAQIPREEAMADYETLEWSDTATKKAMAAKYNIDSKKAKEIQDGVAKYIRSLRASQSSFDEADIRNFSRLGWYDSYKKESEMFDQESRKFVEFLKEYRWNYLVKKGLDKKLNWGSYGLSAADKSAINRYKNAERYLTEHSEEFKEKVDRTDRIYDILQEQMADFRVDFINRIKQDAQRKYRLLPSLVRDNQEIYDNMKAEFDKWCEEEYENHRELWYLWKAKRAAIEKQSNKLSGFKYILKKYTEDEYVAEMHRLGEIEFDNNTKAIAARINEKNINVDTLQVSEVGRDPKYFEMMISDGTQMFYARSVLAAEFSDKMVPHFRFIITDRSRFKK